MTVCRGAAKAKVTNTSVIQQGGLMMLNGAIACGAGYFIAWAIAEIMVSTDRLLTDTAPPCAVPPAVACATQRTMDVAAESIMRDRPSTAIAPPCALWPFAEL